MASKFEIINNALVVTDTVTGKEVFEQTKGRVYYDVDKLNNNSMVVLLDNQSINPKASNLFQSLLSDSQESNGDTFTVASFKSFARRELGKSSPQASGSDFFGFIDYNDTATASNPISVVGAGGYVYLTNDGLGGFTNRNYPPPNVTNVWDVANNRFDFSELTLGSKVDYRLDIVITTTSPNQNVTVKIEMAIGGAVYDLSVAKRQYKNAEAHDLTIANFVYMGDLNTRDNYARFKVKSDGNASIRVKGWACYVFIY